MGKIIKVSIIIFLGLMIHLYTVTSSAYLFLKVDQANWNHEGELDRAFANWQARYVDPLDAYKHFIHPNTPLQKKARNYSLMLLPVTFGLSWIFIWGMKFRRKNYKNKSEYGSHGSARWATNKEPFRKGELTKSPYNELRNGDLNAGVVLGYKLTWWSKVRKRYITIPPDSELNQNVIVYGGSGSGKDFTFIKTQIFNTAVPFEPTGKREKKRQQRLIPKEYSLFTVDPKGEAYRDTSVALEKDGYLVFCFNLVNMAKSHRWNALDYVSSDIDAMKLANMLIANGSTGHTGGDPFWAKAERALMTALILFVKYETEPEQQNLPNVLHIGITYNNESELDILFGSLPFTHPALANYKIFKMAEDKTRSGILIGFGAQLLLFANHSISELTSQSDFRLDDMGRKKIALFLIIPDGDNTFADLSSLFITQALQQWWDVAEQNGGTCPVGIRIIGNEWANISRVPMLAERSSVMRSKGVSMQLYFQSKSQIMKLYDKDGPILIQNCDTTVFLGTNDNETAEDIEKTLGDMTIEVDSVSQPEQGMFANGNISRQYQGRKLRTASEIKRNSRSRNIVVQNASNPFETYKAPFIHHPLAKKYEKRYASEVVPPKHRGFGLFTQDDYDRVTGLAMIVPESDIPVNEVRDNIGLDMIDELLNAGITNTISDMEETYEELYEEVKEEPKELEVDLEVTNEHFFEYSDNDVPPEPTEYFEEIPVIDDQSEENSSTEDLGDKPETDDSEKPFDVVEFLRSNKK